MKDITITVASDANPNNVFELIKTLGVSEAQLNGNIIIGKCRANSVNPLRSVAGVASISTDSEELPKVKYHESTSSNPPATPRLSPPPLPAPSIVPDHRK